MKSLLRRLALPNGIQELKSKNFPQPLKELIESGKHALPKKQMFARAVVGCADLSWPELTDKSDIMEAWVLKQRFLAVATKCATDNGLVVLAQGGEGLVFLANYFENANWTNAIIDFHSALQQQFGQTGLRIGVAMGPTAVGYVNEDPASFTALGPEVNLAIRLCRQAEDNQIIVSSRVWYSLRETLHGWNSRMTHFKVRGFDQIIPCMQLDHAAEEQAAAS